MPAENQRQAPGEDAPMNAERLKQYVRLRREYHWLAANRKTLGQVTDRVRGSMVEFPYTAHTITISGTDPLAARAVRGRMEAVYAEMKRIEDYVAGVEDGLLRASLEMRFLRGKTWIQTGHALHGSEDSVRKAVERFLAREARRNAQRQHNVSPLS